MLKNYWYAIEFADRVSTKPMRVQVFDQDLVLYRDSNGEVVCHSDICIHRGGSLSDGWVKDDCVVCPYHGWEYDSEGTCTKIPANKPGSTIPKKARVDNYPTQERYGYVYAFLGDLPEHERPPLPNLPVLDAVKTAQAEGHRIITGEFHWKANYERVIENGVDAAHAPFVHGGSFGNPDKPEVGHIDLSENVIDGHLNSLTYTIELEPPYPKGLWKFISKKPEERPPVKTDNGIFFPNMTYLAVHLPMGTMTIYTGVVPVSEDHTISKWTMIRDFFTPKIFDRDSWKRTMKIFYEDQITVEGQRPELIPLNLSSELQVKSDAIQLGYRRWRQAALDRGWGIEEHMIGIGRFEGARVLPSPSRKKDPDLENAWVLKEYEAREAYRERAEKPRQETSQ